MVDKTDEGNKRPELANEAMEEAIADLKSGGEKGGTLSEADSTTTPHEQDYTAPTLHHGFLRFMDRENTGYFPAALKSSTGSEQDVTDQILKDEGNLFVG